MRQYVPVTADLPSVQGPDGLGRPPQVYPTAETDSEPWNRLWPEWPPDLLAFLWPELVGRVEGMGPKECDQPGVLVTVVGLATAGWITIHAVDASGWRGFRAGLPRLGEGTTTPWRSRLRLHLQDGGGIPSRWGVSEGPWLSGGMLREVAKRPGIAANSGPLHGGTTTWNAAVGGGYATKHRGGPRPTEQARAAAQQVAGELAMAMQAFARAHPDLHQQLRAAVRVPN